MLLAGPAGCGKTTVAKALCNELGVDVYVINGSDEGRFLDTVRNTAKNFLPTVSLQATGRHKVIIIDEADNTTNDVQLLLRAFTEGFLATADSSLPAISKTKLSNLSTPDAPVLTFPPIPKANPNSPPSSSKRLQEILAEGVEYDNKVLVELINKHFPDWRRVLNECQRYSSSGKIDSGILATFSDVKVNDLVKKLKEKIFPKYVNGSSITWTTILIYFCVVFTMLVMIPWFRIVFLLLCLLLLSISIRWHSWRIKR